MDDSGEEEEPSSGSKYAWLWFLCFLFPPLIVLALPFWIISMFMDSFKDSEPTPEPQTPLLDIPPPVKGPTPKPQPEYDVFPTKSDYEGPDTLWWDVDDVPVGREHNRPEDEWWVMRE
tara:strand:+ start:72 stop:425 length:354 start_codon:yes stop_codon:yes gene_type:complete